MLYFVVGMWVTACLVICGLEKLGYKKLAFSCPCVAIGTLVISTLLYIGHHAFIASVVLIFGIVLTFLFLREWTKRRRTTEKPM